MIKMCPRCHWQYNDEISFDHCPHDRLTRQMKRNQERAMDRPNGNGIVNLDAQALHRKQIDATVRLKRMAAMDSHLNAALQFLTNVPDERRTSAATDAANEFVKTYFENATLNVVDLRSELARDSFELLAQHEAQQAALAAQG